MQEADDAQHCVASKSPSPLRQVLPQRAALKEGSEQELVARFDEYRVDPRDQREDQDEGDGDNEVVDRLLSSS
eukprot:762476-Hanusia_phi.AAC.8